MSVAFEKSGPGLLSDKSLSQRSARRSVGFSSRSQDEDEQDTVEHVNLADIGIRVMDFKIDIEIKLILNVNRYTEMVGKIITFLVGLVS